MRPIRLLASVLLALLPLGLMSAPSQAKAGDPYYGAARVGECHHYSLSVFMTPTENSAAVPCEGATSRVLHVAAAPMGNASPQYRAYAWNCYELFEQALGGTAAQRALSAYHQGWFSADADQQAQGASWFRCDLVLWGDSLRQLSTGANLVGDGLSEGERLCMTDRGQRTTCDRPHAWRAATAIRLTAERYPSTRQFQAIARRRCAAPHVASWMYKEQWAAGVRHIACYESDR